MLVGLNRFSMIWANVLRSTPGNKASTDSPDADPVSVPTMDRGKIGLYVPSSPASAKCELTYVRPLSACSCASWLSNTVIWLKVVFGGGCCLEAHCGVG